MSLNLWNIEREFPVLPVFSFFKTNLFLINRIAFYTLITALISMLIFDKKHSLYFLFGSVLYLLIEDQMRWQPWVYIYLLILIPFLFHTNEKQKLNYYRILFIGIYIWSGIHKLNPFFNDLITESITIDFFRIQNLDTIHLFKKTGYILPVFEISCGLLLFFSSTRKTAVFAISIMHIFILLYLSPFVMNGNYIVYPWNLFMIISIYFLFYNNTDKIEFSFFNQKKHSLLNCFLTFVLVVPSLHFIGFWDTYTSFSLYSGNASNFYVLSKKRIPNLIKHEILKEELEQGVIIDLSSWSTDELNVPIPPEKRIFDQIEKQLSKSEKGLHFLETKTPLWKRKVRNSYMLQKEKQEKKWIQEIPPLKFKDSVSIRIYRKF